MVKTLNTFLWVKCVVSWIQHLEGKEIFEITKRKLDIPISNTRDSYRLDKVNFFQPCGWMRSTTTSPKYSKDKRNSLRQTLSNMLWLHLKTTTIIHQSGTLQKSTPNQMQSIKLNNKGWTSSALPKLVGNKRNSISYLSWEKGRLQNSSRGGGGLLAFIGWHWKMCEMNKK